MPAKSGHPIISSMRRSLLAGILTVIPIWITWLIIEFLLKLLTKVGDPAVSWLSAALYPHVPSLSDWLGQPWFQSVMAIVLVLLALYALGWVATRVIGRRLIAWFDSLIDRIPLVQTIYGAVKSLVAALQQKPDGVQRVVLINFPSSEMKTIGLVTRTLMDEDTGRELAAVYVPTTPNPTSGYLEIVPVENVTSTNWTVNEAMTFIVSGGAVAPERMHYDKGVDGSYEANRQDEG